MIATQRKLNHDQPCLEYGTIKEDAEGFLVETPSGSYRAERAAGCLLNPAGGDFVLTCFENSGRCYILSVLEQNPACAGRNDLVFEGDTTLHVQNGSMHIISDEETALTSDSLCLSANRAETTFGTFSFISSSLSAQVQNVRCVAAKVENIFQQLTERLIDSFRFIKEHEEVQTGSSRYVVETNLTMHSKNAMHVAEEIVTINGEQVHLG